MRPSVRFCQASSGQGLHAVDVVKALFDFLLHDVYAFGRWNSSLTVEAQGRNCWRRLLDNQTDVYATPIAYPRFADVVDYLSVVSDSRDVIVSSVVPVNQTRARIQGTSSLSAINSFPLDVTLLLLLFYLTFYLMLRTHYHMVRHYYGLSRRMEAKKRSAGMRQTAGKMMTGVLTYQFTTCAEHQPHRLSLAFLSLVTLAAAVRFLMLSFTKTHLVVLDEPLVLDSYQTLPEDPGSAGNCAHVGLQNQGPGAEIQGWQHNEAAALAQESQSSLSQGDNKEVRALHHLLESSEDSAATGESRECHHR